MDTDQLVAQGDFEGALARLRQETDRQGADPAALLSRFNMEVRLQQFDAAEQTMQRLCAAAPQVAPVMGALGLAARAERLATERLVHPTLATKRSTPGLPPPHALAYVKMAALHAQGDFAGAAGALAEARAVTPRVSGTYTRVDGSTQTFVDITDSDELTGPNLPCYDGPNLLDIAYSDLHRIAFAEPKTSFDVMWPRAEIVTVTGQVLQVRVPAYYAGTGRAAEAMLRTGQMTTWDRSKGYAVGLGQRDLALTLPDGATTMVGLLRFVAMTFDNPMRATAQRPLAGVEQPWTPLQRGLAGLGAACAFVWFFRPSLLWIGDSPRIASICLGLLMTGCVGVVTHQRSGRVAAGIAAAVTFAFTTLKWIL